MVAALVPGARFLLALPALKASWFLFPPASPHECLSFQPRQGVHLPSQAGAHWSLPDPHGLITQAELFIAMGRWPGLQEALPRFHLQLHVVTERIAAWTSWSLLTGTGWACYPALPSRGEGHFVAAFKSFVAWYFIALGAR